MPTIDTTAVPSPGLRRVATKRTAATLAAATLALTGLFSGAGATLQAPTADAAAKVPNVKALAGDLARQKLTWETCDYGDPGVNERFAGIENVQCTTVKVPRDWHNPGNGKTWDIRVSHAKNLDVKNGRYKGTIFVNPGGPGGSGLPWAAAMQERTPDLNPYYNYVGFDPRGVGQSSRAECTWQVDPADTDPNAALKAGAKACSANEDVKTISTEQTTYDMDFIRSLLAAPKLSYIGYSYGTWLGAWYEKVFGAKYGDKFVLDSSTDVTEPTLQLTWDLQPVARDRQFQRHLINWTARHDAEYKLGTDPAAIYKRYVTASKNVDPFVVTIAWGWLGGAAAFPDNSKYPSGAQAIALVIESYEQSQEQAQSNANPAATLLGAAEALRDKVSGVAAKELKAAKATLQALAKVEPLSAQRLTKFGDRIGRASDQIEPVDEGAADEAKTYTLSEPFDFIRCNDGQWTQGANYWNAWNAKMKKAAPLTASFGMFEEVPICAFWKTKNMMPVADSTFPNTIVVQGELDSQTAWETAYTSGTELPNTSFIAIDNEGSHGHFPYGTEAVDRPIYNYFLKGTMPKDIKVNQALPLPEETVTYESWKKLGSNAKHKGALVTDPFTPAGTVKVTAAAKQIARDDAILNAVVERQNTEKLVKQQYGSKGVKALKKADNR